MHVHFLELLLVKCDENAVFFFKMGQKGPFLKKCLLFYAMFGGYPNFL